MRTDAFVAEIAIDFVNALEAANHEPLEKQLGRNAQVELHVERVVVRHERPGNRSSRHGLHHRGFHFEVILRIQERANVGHYLRANAKNPATVLVHDQVGVTLAIANLLVRQAVEFFRQRTQRFRQQAHVVCFDRQFPGVGFEQGANGANDVPDIPLLELLIDALRQPVALQANLYLCRAVVQLDETGLPHDALDHHATGNADAHRFLGKVVGFVAAVAALQFVCQRVSPEVVRERVTRLPQAIQFAPPLCDQPVFVVCFLVAHLQSLLEAGLNKIVQLAVQNGLRVSGFDAGA